jgi:hypothetical protein
LAKAICNRHSPGCAGRLASHKETRRDNMPDSAADCPSDQRANFLNRWA